MADKYKLQATYKPTGEVLEYGPFDAEGDPTPQILFAQGFICGTLYERTQKEVGPETIEFKLLGVDVITSGTIGTLQAEATATVTHADGSTD